MAWTQILVCSACAAARRKLAHPGRGAGVAVFVGAAGIWVVLCWLISWQDRLGAVLSRRVRNPRQKVTPHADARFGQRRQLCVPVMTSEVQPEVLAATVTPPPEGLRGRGVTHWSARRLADWLARHRGIRVSHDSIAALGRWLCLQPHRSEGFKASTDPALEAKIRDVVGLYRGPLGPVVVCVDETSQLQVLDRIALMLPMRSEQIERQTYDYTCHGTTALFARRRSTWHQIRRRPLTAPSRPRRLGS